MRVLVTGTPLPVGLVADLLLHGVEAVGEADLQRETFHINAGPPMIGFDMAPIDFEVHRDQPSPNRAAVIPANLIRRHKR